MDGWMEGQSVRYKYKHVHFTIFNGIHYEFQSH